MKRKIFTLLTLALLSIGSAWADNVAVSYTYESSASKATMSSNDYFSAASNPTVTTNGSFAAKSSRLQTNVTKSTSATVTFTFTAKDDIKLSSFTFNSMTGSSAITAATVDYYKNSETPTNVNVTFTKSTLTDNVITPASVITLAEGDVFTVKVNLTNTDEKNNRDWQLNTITLAATLAAAPTITAVDAASIKAMTSGVDATQDIDIAGTNLTGSTLTATLSPAVEGLSVGLASNTISAGAINTTATLTYNRTANVKQGTTTLTISDGTTSKDITVTYSAKIVDWTLQSINGSTTWTFDDDNITSGSLNQNVSAIYANIDGMTFGNNFDATALELSNATWPYYSGGKIAQAKTFKFNTTVPGVVKVTYYKAGENAVYISINGGENGSATSSTTTDAIAVSAGDVTIKGYTDAEHGTEDLLNVSKIEFTQTYAITYNDATNGTISGDASAAEGATVTVTTTPDSGYEFIALTIYKASDDSDVTASCSVSNNTFVMPAFAVKVGATFEVVSPAVKTLPYSEDFTTWTGKTFSQGNTTTADVIKGITFYSKSESKQFSASTSGLTFPDNNISSNNYFFAIKMTGVEGKVIKVTIVPGDGYSSSKAKVKYDYKNNTSDVATSGISTSNEVQASSNGGNIVFNVTCTNDNGVLYIGRASGDNQNKTIKSISIEQLTITTTIGATGWSTYSNVYALDFANATPADNESAALSAYMVTGFSGTALTRSDALTSAPGSTGLLLNGTASETYTIPVLASSSTVTTSNKMVASVTEGTVAAGTGSTVNYVLMNNGGSPEFQWIGSTSATLGANKAYLALEGGPKPGASAPGLWFDFGNDGETTGINAVKGAEFKVNGEYYNLAGQRVAQPTKGLYIVNGKKVVIK